MIRRELLRRTEHSDIFPLSFETKLNPDYGAYVTKITLLFC